MRLSIWKQHHYDLLKKELETDHPVRAQRMPAIPEVRESVYNHPCASSIRPDIEKETFTPMEIPRARSNSVPLPYLKSEMP